MQRAALAGNVSQERTAKLAVILANENNDIFCKIVKLFGIFLPGVSCAYSKLCL